MTATSARPATSAHRPDSARTSTTTLPSVPAGWTTSFTGAGQNWVTQSTSSDTPPNSAFGFDGFSGTVDTRRGATHVARRFADHLGDREADLQEPVELRERDELLRRIRSRDQDRRRLVHGHRGRGRELRHRRLHRDRLVDLQQPAGRPVGLVQQLGRIPGLPDDTKSTSRLPPPARRSSSAGGIGFDTSAGAVGQNIDSIAITDVSVCVSDLRRRPPRPAAIRPPRPCDNPDHCSGINASCVPNYASTATTAATPKRSAPARITATAPAAAPTTVTSRRQPLAAIRPPVRATTRTTAAASTPPAIRTTPRRRPPAATPKAQCTNQDYCDGNGGCADNGYKPAATACGDPSSGPCDNAGPLQRRRRRRAIRTTSRRQRPAATPKRGASIRTTATATAPATTTASSRPRPSCTDGDACTTGDTLRRCRRLQPRRPDELRRRASAAQNDLCDHGHGLLPSTVHDVLRSS